MTSTSTMKSEPTEAARGSKQVVLVEGFLDALACYQGGVRNVIPISGATNVSTDLLKLLHHENVEEVLLRLDPDEAGDEKVTVIVPFLHS